MRDKVVIYENFFLSDFSNNRVKNINNIIPAIPIKGANSFAAANGPPRNEKTKARKKNGCLKTKKIDG